MKRGLLLWAFILGLCGAGQASHAGAFDPAAHGIAQFIPGYQFDNTGAGRTLPPTPPSASCAPAAAVGAGAAVAAGAAVGADLGLPALGWENESGNESSPPQAATTASNSAANAGTAQTPHFITNTSVMRGPGAEIR